MQAQNLPLAFRMRMHFVNLSAGLVPVAQENVLPALFSGWGKRNGKFLQLCTSVRNRSQDSLLFQKRSIKEALQGRAVDLENCCDGKILLYST